jgi:hypothetical protein
MANAKQNVVRPDPAQLLQQEIAAETQAIQTRQYAILGRAYSLETPKGIIQLDKQNGPAIAQELVNGEPGPRLLLVGDWPALPDRKGYSEEFCKACLASCTICGGKGKSGCIFVGCGGTGQVKTGVAPCPECVAKVGHYEPGCKTCGGYGAVDIFGPCPGCKGTKLADCGACRGTGKRPAGFTGGAVAVEGKAQPKLCASCRGTMRGGGWEAQDLGNFVLGKLGNYMAFGPVMSITAVPIEGRETRFGSRFGTRFGGGDEADAPSRQLLRLAVPPDECGTPLMVLLPVTNGKLTIPGPAYFFGGAKFA